MASIPSVTSIIASLTYDYSPTSVNQLATGLALAEAQASNAPVTVDIYEGNTAANQAALESYVTGRFYAPATPAQAADAITAPLNITVATIATGTTTETAGEYSAPEANGSQSGLWSYTSADAFDPGLGNVTAAYTITLTPDGTNAESATITAADGTTSTTVIPAGATPSATPATTQFDAGKDQIALTFDAHGNLNVAFSNTSPQGTSTTLDAGISYGTTLAVDTDSSPANLVAGPRQTALVPISSPTTPVAVATKAAPAGAAAGDVEELSFDYQHTFGIDTVNGVVTGEGQSTDEQLGLADLTTGTDQHQQSFDARHVTFLTAYSTPSYGALKFVAYAQSSFGKALAIAEGSVVNTSG